jgi:hypothetical protein
MQDGGGPAAAEGTFEVGNLAAHSAGYWLCGGEVGGEPMNGYSPATLFSIGLEPVPIPSGYKYPKGFNDWQKTDFSYLANSWPPHCGIGLRCGKILGLDMDIYAADVVKELWQNLKSNHPGIVGRVGQAPKILIPFISDEITQKIVSNRWKDLNGVVNAVEILAAGQQFVAFGLHPGTGQPYRWTGDFLEQPMPIITRDEINNLFALFDSLANGRGWQNLSEKQNKTEFKPRETTGDSPGDLYNRAASITDCLEEYGWHHFHGPYWTRPGKSSGISASVLDNAVYIFTSSTSLEPKRVYDPFGLLAHYEYNNDFSAAAKAVLETIRRAA